MNPGFHLEQNQYSLWFPVNLLNCLFEQKISEPELEEISTVKHLDEIQNHHKNDYKEIQNQHTDDDKEIQNHHKHDYTETTKRQK